ncbi:cobalamin-5'-phosphate synthase [Desulforamulus reducens MI-1]|uniref:Adenosylcobinamide-GDP ribazoletransferase n=1 Tax=Desulforamulus reducens (strain ATCC BAA-1160 / DSM 100696 / MI-1) TaxID=349161 RepID=COBS_DESRM|nr:adenosylcobinamide-GDP ribazoletransferase [Desulforamulus reducens]A4J804.1 RecName: Full=Adenosylcobinamide-GDP ribazoletransferase; AltName: Full=Cobalamin synthase; AltName: Full=Cobalamin-5'-phosphate synthase [Desulforamulus reducens MI-1]ABO51207.1 cobalamin-5'-phosphate synthase [Desulforamulus reducens MI-1]
MFSSLRLAISFLTIFPFYNKMADNKELAQSVSYYPLVGFLLGSIAAGVCYAMHSIGLNLAADVLGLVTIITLTGGLHQDGLMDTADGIFSGRELHRKLEIMKDSRVGAMGVIALATVLLLKIAFLFELDLAQKLTAFIMAPMAGRWAMVLAITRYPYARATGGLGACLKQAGKTQLALATLILVAGCLWLFGLPGLALLGIVFFITWLTVEFIVKRLGGMTGDTYGALGEMIETWVIFLILLGQQIRML